MHDCDKCLMGAVNMRNSNLDAITLTDLNVT